MKRIMLLLAAIALWAAPAHALYSVSNRGQWPKSWPQELESLRNEATTMLGPETHLHYLIPFKDRATFEAAWPHLLKVKSKGAPIILVRGPKTDFFAVKPAGVVIHSPPAGQADNPATPEEPIPHQDNVRVRWMNTTYIELAVDGVIVDLNRIPLPADTPIIDERFSGKVVAALETATEKEEFPVSPGAIESTNRPVTADTELKPGQVLQVMWGGTWWAARVLTLPPDGTVKIHYIGWGSNWDEAVPRTRLQLDPDALSKAKKAIAPRPASSASGEFLQF
jgi:hypothetical protein